MYLSGVSDGGLLPCGVVLVLENGDGDLL